MIASMASDERTRRDGEQIVNDMFATSRAAVNTIPREGVGGDKLASWHIKWPQTITTGTSTTPFSYAIHPNIPS